MKSSPESTDIKLPEGPKEYGHFHKIKKRVELALQESEYGFFRPRRLYDEYTVLITQLLDKDNQSKLLNELKSDLTSAHSREEKNAAKQKYWNSLSRRSAFTALNELHEKLEERFIVGFKGGRKIDVSKDHGFFNEVFSSLHKLSPALLNSSLIWEAVRRQGPSDTRLRDLQDLFLAHGKGIESPEYRLLLLAYLENSAKKHMLRPLIRAINHYGGDITIKFSGETDEDVKESKKKVLERIFIGDPTVRRSDKHSIEKIYGTEYYRGLLTQIQEQETNLAKAVWQDKWLEGLDTTKLVAFLKTSNLRKNQTASTILRKMVDALTKGNFSDVRAVAKELILDNPKLYDEWVWNRVGVTFEDVESEEFKRLEEKTRLKQAAQDKAREVVEIQLSHNRSPELWLKIEPFVGKLGLDENGNPIRIVRATERFSRQKGIFKRIPGYVIINYIDENGKGRAAIPTYGYVWKKIESGEWTFPD